MRRRRTDSSSKSASPVPESSRALPAAAAGCAHRTGGPMAAAGTAAAPLAEPHACNTRMPTSAACSPARPWPCSPAIAHIPYCLRRSLSWRDAGSTPEPGLTDMGHEASPEPYPKCSHSMLRVVSMMVASTAPVTPLSSSMSSVLQDVPSPHAPHRSSGCGQHSRSSVRNPVQHAPVRSWPTPLPLHMPQASRSPAAQHAPPPSRLEPSGQQDPATDTKRPLGQQAEVPAKVVKRVPMHSGAALQKGPVYKLWHVHSGATVPADGTDLHGAGLRTRVAMTWAATAGPNRFSQFTPNPVQTAARSAGLSFVSALCPIQSHLRQAPSLERRACLAGRQAHLQEPRPPQGACRHASHGTPQLLLVAGTSAVQGGSRHVAVRVCTPCIAAVPPPTESHCAVHLSQAPTAHGFSSHICPLQGRVVGMLLVTEAPHSLSNSNAPTLSAVRPVGSKETLFCATSHDRILQGQQTHSARHCLLDGT